MSPDARVTELHPADPTRGLPERSDLSLRTRAVVDASAAADVGLRTLAASMVTASMVPLALSRSRLRAERAALDFYGDLAEAGDVARSFPAPDGPHEVRARRVRALPLRGQQGTVELLSFESRFRAVHPAMQDAYAAHRRNRIGRAQHWRHDPEEGPRPTLCVIHGFTASPYWVNSAFFSLPWFFYNGYDVLLYTLPFHGRRQSRRSPYSGHGYFAHGFANLNEAMAHAVHDFRVLVDHLLATSASRVGVTGLSLGGYTSALLAAVEDRLAVVIPNAAVTDLPSLIHSWHPAASVLSLALKASGIPRTELDRALRYSSPLSYEPVVAKEHRFIVAGLGDRLAPPEQSEWLWEHWDRCRMHWFPGNHVLHVNRVAYLREMREVMQAADFA
ncbi:MAG TPA: prolyl oligopeptidase family serine peptidase [Acidimicrobiales bacterium]|nr:prolyl oligopeptidase family serine peptidase [Acidimicrobiales bacterium]